MICSSSGPLPTLLKRLTFKSISTQQGLAKIKFLGVAGGTVQLEDCMFDATDNTDADAVYTNAKIAGIFPFLTHFDPLAPYNMKIVRTSLLF